MLVKNRILEKLPPELEIERKYSAADYQSLHAISEIILNDQKHFITPEHASLNQDISNNCDLTFAPPYNVSCIRHRIYYDTQFLTAHKNNIEMRQEDKSDYVRQTIKTYEERNNSGNFTRLEHEAKLTDAGISLNAVKSTKHRKQIKGALGDLSIKPLIRLTSQRISFDYHPKGQKDIIIEICFDQIFGQTIDGFTWPFFQVELEMKKSPTENITTDEVLDNEEKILLQQFELKKDLYSKPTNGFEHLKSLRKEKIDTLFQDADINIFNNAK